MANTNKVNLLLKRGVHKNLPQQGQFENGTLYFTTDEGGLYLGLEKGQGIRMQGSVLYFSTLQQFYDNVKPPYSTDVLYFIEKNYDAEKAEYQMFNALMRWDEENSKWIQINATADSFQAALEEIADVKDRVSNIEENIGYVSKTENGVTTPGDGILGDVEVLQNKVDTLEENLGTPEEKEGDTVIAPASGLFATVKENAEKIEALDQRLTDIDEENGRLDDIEDAIDDINTSISGLNERLTEIDKKDGQLDKIKNDLNQKASQSDLDVLSELVGTPKTETDDAKGIFASLEEINETLGNKVDTDDYNDLVESVRALDSTDSGKPGRVTVIENILGKEPNPDGTTEAEKTGSGLLKQVSDNAKEISNNAGDIAENTQRIDDIEALLGIGDDSTPGEEGQKSLLERVDDLESTASDHGEAITSLQETKADKTELEEVGKQLTSKIDNHILAANAMKYKGITDGLEGSSEGVKNPLPTEKVQIGDTYIASKSFSLGENKVVYAGDLIIANGVEDDVKPEEGENDSYSYIKEGTLEWQIIDTGYIEAHENILKVENEAIVLKSHLNNDLATVKITSASENVNVQYFEETNTISVGLTWDTF